MTLQDLTPKLPVAVLGATGAVGQRFIQLLAGHPWFTVAEVVASERSAGKRYADAVHWVLEGAPPDDVAALPVKPLDAVLDAPLVFSALPKEAATEFEVRLAAAGHVVCTNASAYRMAPDVPLIIPEVNADHVALVEVQRARRGWGRGALVANSNCTVMPVVMALAPLRPWGVTHVHVVSLQAVSGAGYPGVSALDILDNVVPFIPGEEDKLAEEAVKMLGQHSDGTVTPLAAVVGAACHRVPVVDAHLVAVSVTLAGAPSPDEVRGAWHAFRAPADVASLPSAPPQPIIVMDQPDRPQPRRDRMAGHGMSTSVGRLRPCPLLGLKFVALSHNTIRGAAGGSILNAELLAARGYLPGFEPVPRVRAHA